MKFGYPSFGASCVGFCSSSIFDCRLEVSLIFSSALWISFLSLFYWALAFLSCNRLNLYFLICIKISEKKSIFWNVCAHFESVNQKTPLRVFLKNCPNYTGWQLFHSFRCLCEKVTSPDKPITDRFLRVNRIFHWKLKLPNCVLSSWESQHHYLGSFRKFNYQVKNGEKLRKNSDPVDTLGLPWKHPLYMNSDGNCGHPVYISLRSYVYIFWRLGWFQFSANHKPSLCLNKTLIASDWLKIEEFDLRVNNCL